MLRQLVKTMIEKTATIQNEQGIHCRPASVILNEMKGYTGDIHIFADGRGAKLMSVMGLLGLGLERGRTITIRVDGPDEEAVCGSLVDLFEYNFDFPSNE
jgi:phosphocarrier protein